MNVANHPIALCEYHYSPPVSPKSQPHGCKRKASSRDDDDAEVESQNVISSSLKRLRLNNLKKVQHASVQPGQSLSRPVAQSFPISVDHASATSKDEDADYMPVDDTTNRVWVHDLNAEIAEIEAEEEKARQALLSETANEYSKIPEHLLKQPVQPTNPAASMQMVLYRDPTSISVPAEEDAVRQTILDARRRMREKQASHRGEILPTAPAAEIRLRPVPNISLDAMTNDDDEENDDEESDMLMDLD